MLPNPITQRFAHLRQWCAWELTEDGKKIPVTRGGRLASIADPTTWIAFSEAELYARYVNPERGGVMLALTPELRLLVVDLDHVLAVNRVTSPAAREFILAAQTYTEITPSRKGLHVWLELDEPWRPAKCKLPSAEAYTERRFITVTGWQIRFDGTFAVIDHEQSFPLRKIAVNEAKRLLALLGYSEPEPSPAATPPTPASARLTPKQAAGILSFLVAQHQSSKNRNSALYWAALRLREAGVTQQDAEAVLVPIVAANGLPQREALRTIASAYGRKEVAA